MAMSSSAKPMRWTHALTAVAAMVLLAVLASHAAADSCLWLEDAVGGEETTVTLSSTSLNKQKCRNGLMVFSVVDAKGNTASFPSPYSPKLQFKPDPSLVFYDGLAYTEVIIDVTCNEVTPLCSSAPVYFVVKESATSTTSTTTTPNSTTTTPVVVPACSTGFVYPVTFGTISQQTLTVDEADALLCPVGPGEPHHFVFSSGAPPTYNPDEFVLDPSGWFTYHAPPGPPVKRDSFGLSVGCASGATVVPGEMVHPICTSTVTIRTRAPLPPQPAEECTGDFHYVYRLNSDGSFSPKMSNLAARATVVENAGCPGNSYTAAKLTTSPSNGTIDDLDVETGTFTYTPTAALVTPMEKFDSFRFQLSCADKPSFVCEGSATIAVAAAESSDAVYHVSNDLITCKGSCNAHRTTRQDGRKVGSMDFDFTSTGKLLIHAYTVISPFQTHFVTFTPMQSLQGLLTSVVAPPGSHVSFQPKCLDSQASYGNASNVATWTNPSDDVKDVSKLEGVQLNTATDNYRLGENYFQKFGGLHQNCDVFRENPCKLAPLLTPTPDDDNNNAENNFTSPVQWKLYVNGCDATWVGEASVESLRALRQVDKSATFTLLSESKLSGTIYVASIVPADITDPSKGIISSSTPYSVVVSIKNTVVVDVKAVSSDAVPPAEQMSMAADIQFAVGRDRFTNERIYAYSILLFPRIMVDGVVHSVNTSEVKLNRVYLESFSITSPNHVECPQCTGSKSVCRGTGDAYKTDCGDEGIVSFGPLDSDSMEYDRTEASPGGANLFPSTSISGTAGYYNVSFAVRANGKDSAESADAFPVGSFSMVSAFSNGQKFNFTVEQSDYVSEINSKFVRTVMCRASAYWPVENALGGSVPVAPFDPASLSGLEYDSSGNPVPDAQDKPSAQPSYEAPTHLSSKATCSLPVTSLGSAVITLSSDTAKVGNLTVSMCAVEEERTYGVTDWFTLSIPSIQAERSSIQDAVGQAVIQDPSLDDTAYTVAELQYLILSIDASEAIATPVTDLPLAGQRVNILLDGTNPPTDEISEEDRWMYPDANEGDTYKVYPWAEFASFLNYRRIRYEHADKDSATAPFNFAFIPGALLHSRSSVRVPMQISLSVKFTTYAKTKDTDTVAAQPVVVNVQEEKMFYIISVSRATSAAMRFDSDVYEPKIVTVRTAGLGKKSATALLIIILVAVAVVLAGSIYVEVTYKRIIHNAKYHPKRPDSAVGVRYGRDGQPISGAPDGKDAGGQQAGDARSAATGGSATGSTRKKGAATDNGSSVKTKFGSVGIEPTRVTDLGDDTDPSNKETGAGEGVQAEERPPIGEEQQRVADSEVASQV